NRWREINTQARTFTFRFERIDQTDKLRRPADPRIRAIGPRQYGPTVVRTRSTGPSLKVGCHLNGVHRTLHIWIETWIAHSGGGSDQRFHSIGLNPATPGIPCGSSIVPRLQDRVERAAITHGIWCGAEQIQHRGVNDRPEWNLICGGSDDGVE